MIEPAFLRYRTAALYDALQPWQPCYEFYLGEVMSAASVLDVACGTGSLLCRAREAGHGGELVGVDPAPGMLEVAQGKRDDVEWRSGDVRALDLDRRFDLVTMMGHAFQALEKDGDVLAALTGLRRHLADDGRLVFEVRNPAARAWERWNPDDSRRVVREAGGGEVEVFHEVRGLHPPDLVDFVTTYRFLATGEVVESAATLRFVDPRRLEELMARAGLRITRRLGGWDGRPVGPDEPEFIVTATRG